MSRLRPAVGPLIVAAAAWCAAGRVSVLSAGSAAARMATPAPWWVFVAALALASAVPAWRRRPWRTVPAVLSTLPWWPVPLPASALIWSGPLAWLPVGLALAAAVGSRPPAWVARRIRADDCRRAPFVAAAIVLAAGTAAAWSLAPRVPGGDEPHYLIITQSLLEDGDLRIENNHRQRDYAAYYAGDLQPDAIQRGRDGAIYSIHAPGLSVFVLPAFALFGYRGAEAMLLLAAALASWLIWRIGWRVAGDPVAGWFAWAAVAGSATFLLQSFQIFPDMVGAVPVAAAVLLYLRLGRGAREVGPRGLVVVSVLLAALPWLHTRFVVLAVGWGLAIAWRLMRDAFVAPGQRAGRLLWFLTVPAVSAAAWFGFFWIIYGTPNPAAPYGGEPSTSLAFIPGGLTALLFDEQFGLLVYTPVLGAAALAVFARRGDRVTREAALALLITAAYFAAVAAYWMWWAGRPAVPARFATAGLPGLAVPLALVWHRAAEPRRRLLTLLLGSSLAISALVLAVGRGVLAWNDRTGQARWLEWLNPVVNLPRVWPSFFWRLDPDRLSTEWPFAIHAAMAIAMLLVLWSLAVWFGRKRQWDSAAWRVSVACWFGAGLMACAAAGWRLTEARPLDPARSQSALLGDAAAGRPMLLVGPWGWRRARAPRLAMTIRSDEPGLLDQATLLAVDALPPGTYQVRIDMRHPARGRANVRIGGAAGPGPSWDLQPLSEQTWELSLPSGARPLLIVGDQAARAAGARAELTGR